MALARPSSRHLLLDKVKIKFKARRNTVDHNSNREAVTFTKRRDGKPLAKCTGHKNLYCAGCRDEMSCWALCKSSGVSIPKPAWLASQTKIDQPASTARSCSSFSICSRLEAGRSQNLFNPNFVKAYMPRCCQNCRLPEPSARAFRSCGMGALLK